jgi:hypothetical protein
MARKRFTCNAYPRSTKLSGCYTTRMKKARFLGRKSAEDRAMNGTRWAP